MKTTQSPQVDKELARETKSFDYTGIRADDTQTVCCKGDPISPGCRKRVVEDMNRSSGLSHSTTKNGGRETFSSDSRNQNEIGLNPEPKIESYNKRKADSGGGNTLNEIGQPNVLDG